MTTLTESQLLIWAQDNVGRIIGLVDGRKVKLKGCAGNGNIFAEEMTSGHRETLSISFSLVTGFEDGYARECLVEAARSERCGAEKDYALCVRRVGHAGEHISALGYHWGDPIEYAKPKLSTEQIKIWAKDNAGRSIRLIDGEVVTLLGFAPGTADLISVRNSRKLYSDYPFSLVTGFADDYAHEHFLWAVPEKRCEESVNKLTCMRTRGHAGEHAANHSCYWGHPVEYAKPALEKTWDSLKDEALVINFDVGKASHDRAPQRDLKTIGDSHNVLQRKSIEEETLALRGEVETLLEFICELNLQDHPRAVQQRQRELIHTAKKILKPEGSGK